MANKKRFRLGNTTINLGKVEDIHKYQPIPNCGLTHLTCGVMTRWKGPPFTNGCFPWTHGGGCGINYSTLPPTTLLGIPGDVLRTDPQPALTFEHLKEIKASMKKQLKEIEAYEVELKSQEKPQTLEEMHALENELEHSLKELKKMKKDFKG